MAQTAVTGTLTTTLPKLEHCSQQSQLHVCAVGFKFSCWKYSKIAHCNHGARTTADPLLLVVVAPAPVALSCGFATSLQEATQEEEEDEEQEKEESKRKLKQAMEEAVAQNEANIKD